MSDAARLLGQQAAVQLDDPARWIAPWLWRGTVDEDGTDAPVFVGSFDEVAGALHGFASCGITHCMVRDRAGRQSMVDVGAELLPLLRTLESAGD